jgi:hypothetical protein
MNPPYGHSVGEAGSLPLGKKKTHSSVDECVFDWRTLLLQ